MAQQAGKAKTEAAARVALRRRVMRWYEHFNSGAWSNCFSFLDPRLSGDRVDSNAYTDSLRGFKKKYGSINPWHIRVSLHLKDRAAADARPFAYVYVVWQDDRHDFHMFRERWIREGKKWYSRVAGLVPGPANES